jgi:hypothetical protein
VPTPKAACTQDERRLSEVSRQSEPQRAQDGESISQTRHQGEVTAPAEMHSQQQQQVPQQLQRRVQQQQQQQQHASQTGSASQKISRPRGGERERDRKARKAAAAESAAEGGPLPETTQATIHSHKNQNTSDVVTSESRQLPVQSQLQTQQQPIRRDQPGRQNAAMMPVHSQNNQPSQFSNLPQQNQQHQPQLFQSTAPPEQQQLQQTDLQQQYAQRLSHPVAGAGGLPPQLVLNVGMAPVSAPFSHGPSNNGDVPQQQLQSMSLAPHGLPQSQGGPLAQAAPPRLHQQAHLPRQNLPEQHTPHQSHPQQQPQLPLQPPGLHSQGLLNQGTPLQREQLPNSLGLSAGQIIPGRFPPVGHQHHRRQQQQLHRPPPHPQQQQQQQQALLAPDRLQSQPVDPSGMQVQPSTLDACCIVLLLVFLLGFHAQSSLEVQSKVSQHLKQVLDRFGQIRFMCG